MGHALVLVKAEAGAEGGLLLRRLVELDLIEARE